MANRLRPHLTVATPTTPVVTPTTPVATVPRAAQPTTRDVTLEVSDTAMGTIIPINLGRFRASFKVVHFDIVLGRYIELVALIGEGPIDGVESIWVDSNQVYGAGISKPAWVTSLVIRTGTNGQTPPGNITNSTIAQLAWPGFAYVSIRMDLQTAPISGGIPRVEIAGRGLWGWNYGDTESPAADLPLCWSENPFALMMALMRSPDFGCGLSKSVMDALENTPGTSWYDAAIACDQVVDRLSVQASGNTTSNTAAGADYDRGQSFVAVNDSFAVQVKIKVLDHGADGKGFPDLFQLWANEYGTPAPIYPVARLGGVGPGWTCSTDPTTFPLVPTPINGPGDYYLTAWFGNDINLPGKGQIFTAGTTYYLMMPMNASVQWYMNSQSDTYAGGNALGKQYASWTPRNYDMWFQTAAAEKLYRLELTITQRQPIEQAVTPILQVCNGRWGVWDGLYRVSIDDLATGSLVISDQESDNPDILIVQDTLQCTRSTPDVPNVAIGDYLDAITWNRCEVAVLWLTVTEGLDQYRELRFSCLAVPSGDQMYRLLSTWLARGRRSWKAAFSVPQHGIRVHPGMTAFLKSRLFASTKKIIVDTVNDNAAGTFDLTVVEYSAADFCTSAYVPQTVVNTVTQLAS